MLVDDTKRHLQRIFVDFPFVHRLMCVKKVVITYPAVFEVNKTLKNASSNKQAKMMKLEYVLCFAFKNKDKMLIHASTDSLKNEHNMMKKCPHFLDKNKSLTDKIF